MVNKNGFAGTLDATAGQGDYNAFAFLCMSLINQVCTMQPVIVKAVNGATVSVQPMVNQIDGDGTPTPHGIIHGLPFQRIQGGVSAVIINPVVGDIGFAVFASHDISSVKANKAPSNPGSRRRYAWSDGVYIGGILNGTPTEFIEFANGGGITATTPGPYTINAGGKTWTFTGAGLTLSDGVVAETHQHQYVPGTSGSANTGPPIA